MATSGRGAGRNRPRGSAGPARGPRPPRSAPSRRDSSRSRARGPQPRGAQSRGAPSRGAQPRGAQAGGPKGTTEQPARQRHRLTGRSAIVIVVLAVLFVSYASSLRAFLSQRAHINELEMRIAQNKQAVAELREERRRWTDEAFIEAQARERFGWVLPGEIGFRVIGENGKPLDAASQLTDPASLGQDPDAQWWSTTWASIRGAGVDRSDQPAPARRLGPVPQRQAPRGGPQDGTRGR